MALITTKPISRLESHFLVKWLREHKAVKEQDIDLYFFTSYNIGAVILECQKQNIKLTEREVLVGLHRIMDQPVRPVGTSQRKAGKGS